MQALGYAQQVITGISVSGTTLSWTGTKSGSASGSGSYNLAQIKVNNAGNADTLNGVAADQYAKKSDLLDIDIKNSNFTYYTGIATATYPLDDFFNPTTTNTSLTSPKVDLAVTKSLRLVEKGSLTISGYTSISEGSTSNPVYFSNGVPVACNKLYAHHISVIQNSSTTLYAYFTIINYSSTALTGTTIGTYLSNMNASGSYPLSATGSYNSNTIIGVYSATSGSLSVVYRTSTGTSTTGTFNQPLEFVDRVIAIS